VPFWADDLSIGNRLINARCETVHTLRAFREAYSRRRCLVPADGFYEWQKQGKLRQPFLIRRKDQAPFAFAGLWERWRQPEADDVVVRSCTIITCPPNDLVAPLHDRMPVILAPEAHARWLDPKTDARGLLKPCPSAWMYAIPMVVVGRSRTEFIRSFWIPARFGACSACFHAKAAGTFSA
jgi:putative SOS response-associated peptidase YedK